jgi:hypothetical protein
MTLPGPSRRIIVVPIEEPAEPAVEPLPAEPPEAEPVPEPAQPAREPEPVP